MSDLLVKLYELPFFDFSPLEKKGFILKRVIAPEKRILAAWVEKNFSQAWASECDVACSRVPSSCFAALKDGEIKGFACYDAASLGFFGPVGVLESERGSGLGKALLFKTLGQMKNDGYSYAFIGWAGPVDFFKKTVNASIVEGSEPGIYRDMLRKRN